MTQRVCSLPHYWLPSAAAHCVSSTQESKQAPTEHETPARADARIVIVKDFGGQRSDRQWWPDQQELLGALIAVSVGAASLLHAQVTLRAGQSVTSSLQDGRTPVGISCVVVGPGTPSSASVDLLLDSHSMQGNGSFRIEILVNPGGASSVWAGSNSPLSLSVVGYFYAGFGGIRLTGLTAEVVITRIAMPWITSEYDSGTRQFRSCLMDGDPFVPNLHLDAAQEGPGQLRLRWTTNTSEFRLVATDSLPAPAWIEVTNARNVLEDYFEMTLDSPNAHRFFQLRKP